MIFDWRNMKPSKPSAIRKIRRVACEDCNVGGRLCDPHFMEAVFVLAGYRSPAEHAMTGKKRRYNGRTYKGRRDRREANHGC